MRAGRRRNLPDISEAHTDRVFKREETECVGSAGRRIEQDFIRDEVQAVGIALAQRIRGFKDSWTYAIVGDGESQEGEVWEAAEVAGAQKLDNLIAFTDLNKQQLDGYTDDIIPMYHLKERYETFGFDAYEVDGHDFNQVADAIASAKSVKGKPHMIILNTVKSFGYIPGEGVKGNHSMSINEETRKSAIDALVDREGGL